MLNIIFEKNITDYLMGIGKRNGNDVEVFIVGKCALAGCPILSQWTRVTYWIALSYGIFLVATPKTMLDRIA